MINGNLQGFYCRQIILGIMYNWKPMAFLGKKINLFSIKNEFVDVV